MNTLILGGTEMTDIINKQQLDKLWNALEYTRETISPSGNFESKEHPGWVEIHKGRAHQSESFLNDAIDLVNQLKKRTETTDEQILQLAKSYGFDRHISKTTNDIYWECDEEDFLKFARKIFEEEQQEEIRRQKTGIGYVNGMLVVDEF